jgi:hypothetical protein
MLGMELFPEPFVDRFYLPAQAAESRPRSLPVRRYSYKFRNRPLKFAHQTIPVSATKFTQ